jgi:hypothetical protein
MNVKYATYIDHQKEIGYPIEFLQSVNPDLIVFCSDIENQLKPDWIVASIKIFEPNDISNAQNWCIGHLFEQGYDFVVWQQADVYITPIGQRLIDEFIKPENIGKTMSLRTTMLRLFHHCGFTDFGVNVIGREAWASLNNKFSGDGAYLGTGGANTNPILDAAIDIGYLTIDQARNHIKQHKKTWQAEDNIVDLSDAEFVKALVKRHNVYGMIDLDSFNSIVQLMKLENEFEKVKSMI